MSDLNLPLRIIERRAVSRDCLALRFEKPRGFTYGPGDWMDIRFPTPEFPVGRTYSFASAPTEPDLLIAFKQGGSPFKQRMASAAPGDLMLITQYGSNGFVLDRRFPSVFIAGGVGIPPFRSMLKDLVDTHAEAEITLIYLDRTDDFPFRRELDQWRHLLPSFTVRYVPTATEGRLTGQTLRAILPDIADGQRRSYVAGPPDMVDATEALLYTLGCAAEAIKTDRFDGY